MRQHGRKQAEEAAIDLTPMLDVVFIMLIFFIVTATFVKEAGITVRRPEVSTGEAEPKASIMIAITAKDDVYIQRQRYDIDAVRTTIERLYAENPRGSVVIIPDEASTVDAFSRVQEAVKAAGVERVVLAVEPS